MSGATCWSCGASRRPPIVVLPESHTDHGITGKQRTYALEVAAARLPEDGGVLVTSVNLPIDIGTVPCGLYGPEMGDQPIEEEDVTYQVRGGRTCSSRTVALPARTCSTVTVVAGPHGEHRAALYTIYGGPAAPREAWDPSLTVADLAESLAFWSEHALAAEVAK